MTPQNTPQPDPAWRTDPDAAYREAQRRIAVAREQRTGSLDLSRLWALQALPPEIRDLTELESLDCDHTEVSDLLPLSGLPGLQVLDCGHTEVSDLSPLSGLPGLQSLACLSTPVSDLSPLSGLTGLQWLNCRSTGVSDLSPLADLPGLRTLNLSACRIGTVPDGFWLKPSLNKLRAYRTQLPGDIPVEVLSRDLFENCLPTLRAYLLALEAGAVPVRAAKVLILGNGRAGKTQLARRLTRQAFTPDWDSTHGIDTGQVTLPGTGDDPGTTLHLWDFGGQDIYHGTHALFVQRRTVFVIAWSPDTDNAETYTHDGITFRNHPLAYWVDYARHLAPDSPVLIVQTKCQEPGSPKRPPLGDPALAGLAWVEAVRIDSRTGYGLPVLETQLRAAVDHLNDVQGISRIGGGWAAVRDRIVGLPGPDGALPADRRLIDRATFDTWCAEAGLTPGQGGQSGALLTYLHRTGWLYHDPERLPDRIILDLRWALEAIYAVFDRQRCYTELRRAGGRFTRHRLGTLLWDAQGFNAAEQDLFIDLMRSCRICFRYRDPRDEGEEWEEGAETVYIAPDLLPDRAAVELDLAQRWSPDAGAVTTTYCYPLLHGGLMRALIARIGEEAQDDALYWQGGVWVYDLRTGARAVIEQDVPAGGWAGTVTVQAYGPRAPDLLDDLRRWIERENQALGLRPETDGPTLPFRRASEGEAAAVRPGAEPAGSYHAYLSYAWEDQDDTARAGHEDRIRALLADGHRRGKPLRRDKEHMRHNESITAFMQALGAAHRVGIIIDEKYLHSPNCLFELWEIWRQSRQDEAEFARRAVIHCPPDLRLNHLDRLEHFQSHWQDRLGNVDAYLKRQGANAARAQQDRGALISGFLPHLQTLLCLIADRTQTGGWDAFVERLFADD